MTKLSREAIIAELADCKTRPELHALHKELLNSDPVLTEARERRTMHNRAKRDREREIIKEEQAPWHEEAKRWKHGDKVYFGKKLESTALGWDFKPIKGSSKRIEPGDWCYVWEYQPRVKILWLCKTRSALKYENVYTTSFSLGDICRHEISRVEPKLRKDGWR